MLTIMNHWRRLLPLYLAFLIAFPLGMVWVEMTSLDGPATCLFRIATRLDCPSCGLTRAFQALGRLDVHSAIRYNPLSPLVFLITVALWGYCLAQVASRGRVRLPDWWQRRQGAVVFWGMMLFVIIGVIRIGYELRYPPPPPIFPGDALHWLWPR